MKNLAIEQDGSARHGQFSLLPEEMEKAYESVRIGADGSIDSLQQFLGPTTEIKLNCLSFLSLPVLLDRINCFYRDNLGFHIRFTGDVTGEIFTFLSKKDALTIIEQIMVRCSWLRLFKREQLNKIEISALGELVNIISNSFWRALTDQTTINWRVSPPTKLNNLYKSLAYTSQVYSGDCMMIQLEYKLLKLNARIHFVLLPTPYTLKTILTQSAFSQSMPNQDDFNQINEPEV